MRDDHPNNSIVSGPPKWRWPWDRARDVDVGSPSPNRIDLGGARPALGTSPAAATTTPAAPTVPAAKTPGKARMPRVNPASVGSGPAAWKQLLATAIILVALIYHAAPQVARLVGTDEARMFLTWLAGRIPTLGEFDAGRWFGPAAAAWMWQPVVAAGGAGLLRLLALNTARREPVGALWLAFFAFIIDAATWVFMGLKLQGLAFDGAEAHALITLLKVEGAVLLVAFFVLAPTGKKRLGQTDADFNGDN